MQANRFRFLDGSISEEDVAVAVNADQKVLFNILNKGILEMKKNNEYSHINLWLTTPFQLISKLGMPKKELA